MNTQVHDSTAGIWCWRPNRQITLHLMTTHAYSLVFIDPTWHMDRHHDHIYSMLCFCWQAFNVTQSMLEIALTSLTSRACRTTSVSPLSWSDDSRDGSWNTYTVTTSVAVETKTMSQQPTTKVLSHRITLHDIALIASTTEYKQVVVPNL